MSTYIDTMHPERHAPYEDIPRDVRDFEPHLALDGGVDGLDFYRRLAVEAPKHLVRGGTLLVECGQGQAQDIVLHYFQNVEIVPLW